jgi:hypothetical protein
VVPPLPGLPPNTKKRDLGEREWQVGMKQKIINSDYEVRLSLLLEFPSQEELDALLPSVLDRALKREL